MFFIKAKPLFPLAMLCSGFLTFISGGASIAAEKAKDMMNKDLYQFSFQNIDGGPLPLTEYKGKVLLIVNTASRCGFTKQYEGLQDLFEKYSAQGLVVLGVPSNDFMGQEPGSNAEIKEFCETTFGITFPMAEKVSVKGRNAHPFYLWVSQLEGGDTPGWNFHKFLFDRNGKLLGSFGSSTAPDSNKINDAIEAAIKN